ncbi:subtilisin-like protease SBT4.15 [Ziziphus jujuba]|uniref:Subtilisin-like protease SBT4.15 n=1 Tax=Ziziphus jujuba TaxID=326968 RepID=A0A6P4AWU0_ZIZJJ|nr:subtilisin-like protease SBT4.15 [Ziziphus jujuba]
MSKSILVIFFIYIYFIVGLVYGQDDHERKTYIVYLGELPEAGTSVVDSHHKLLLAAIGDEKIARESKIHSYGKSFNGFAARLLPHEAKKLLDEKSVISVFPNQRRNLHTTRSWDYLGLPLKLGMNSLVESNLIVGVLDTGIWMDCPSFNDKGFGPPPAKWKGKCVKAANFSGCNNKVVGAKYFRLDSHNDGDEALTPADEDGHGSHTSSTAAGVAVKGASLYGVGEGTARGGAALSRIAMYKVCWLNGCFDVDILAAFDEAIADGVDLISVSLGGPTNEYFADPIAIGSFHALKKGILTSCSAGNDGPYTSSVSNVAPWILTVGANSIDRQFTTMVKLGNGQTFYGKSINTFSPKKAMYPLTDGTHAASANGSIYGNASNCDDGTLAKNKVKGRIVYCEGSYDQESTIEELEGLGTIMTYEGEMDFSYLTLVPATYVAQKDGDKVDRYINSTKDAQGVIYRTTRVKAPAPFLASFSSRGPQTIDTNILKPDITAPGIDILAAYSQIPSVSGDSADKRHAVFNIMSGTSMACPHAAAAAAYVKSFHTDWSPAAIKSALMTTATPLIVKGREADLLGAGAGQINPVKAVHPGLIYDLSTNSYISFLCKEGYNSSDLSLLIGGKKKYKCSDFKPAQGTDGLNYPTMHIQLNNPQSRISGVFYRTVTNVGYGKTVYKVKINSPKGLSVKVSPDTLAFTKLHQQLSFKVEVKGGAMQNDTQILSALLEWSDSKHSVKSHILIYRPLI